MSTPKTMPAAEFKGLRESIGDQLEVAAAMKTDPRTMRRWETGERKVPGPADVLIQRLALEAAERRAKTLRLAAEAGAVPGGFGA